MVYEVAIIGSIVVIADIVYSAGKLDREIRRRTGTTNLFSMSADELKSCIKFFREYKTRNPIMKIVAKSYLSDYIQTAKERNCQL